MSRSKRNAAAEDYLKRAPNYSAGAIEYLRLLSGRADIPEAARISGEVADMIEAAHKFVLPDNGILFGPLADNMFDEVRLPFGHVVLEFDAVGEGKPRPNGIKCERRVVLCFEKAGHTGDPVVSILPITWSSKDERWLPSPVFVEIPCKRKVDYYAVIVALGEPGKKVLERDDAKELLTDSSLEIQAVIEFCAAISCTNVTTEILRPNREARAARPASTLFDYHVLMIEPGREHATSEDRGGTHASPRTHLRRGHIRRLAWGPRVWVNSCVVNPSAIGTVNKDYAVKRGGR